MRAVAGRSTRCAELTARPETGMAVWEQESRERSREKSPGFTTRTSASQTQNGFFAELLFRKLLF